MCPRPLVSHLLIFISKGAILKWDAIETDRSFSYKWGIFMPGFINKLNSKLKQIY